MPSRAGGILTDRGEQDGRGLHVPHLRPSLGGFAIPHVKFDLTSEGKKKKSEKVYVV
jgi:hypothetical protein